METTEQVLWGWKFPDGRVVTSELTDERISRAMVEKHKDDFGLTLVKMIIRTKTHTSNSGWIEVDW